MQTLSALALFALVLPGRDARRLDASFRDRSFEIMHANRAIVWHPPAPPASLFHPPISLGQGACLACRIAANTPPLRAPALRGGGPLLKVHELRSPFMLDASDQSPALPGHTHLSRSDSVPPPIGWIPHDAIRHRSSHHTLRSTGRDRDIRTRPLQGERGFLSKQDMLRHMRDAHKIDQRA